MAITKAILAQKIEKAMNKVSDKDIDPAAARKQVAVEIADALETYVIGRTTIVSTTGTAAAQTGTGIIQ